MATDYENLSIHVIDNASTDQSIQYLIQFNASINIVQLSDNHGFAGGYNKGLEGIDADLFVLLNSDVRVDRDWLHPLVKVMEQDEVGACQPKILSDQQPEQFEYAGACGGFLDYLGFAFCRGRIFNQVEEDIGQYNDTTNISWATGAALCIRPQLFVKLGGFDESYFAHFEEIDLCWRLRRAGYKIVCAPSSIVYHLGGGTLSYQSANKVFLNYRNNMATIIKNNSWGRLCWLLPFRFFLEVVSAYKYLVGGYASYFIAVAKAHYQVIGRFRTILQRRKEDNARITAIRRKTDFNPNETTYKNSIVVDFFLRGKRKFSELKI